MRALRRRCSGPGPWCDAVLAPGRAWHVSGQPLPGANLLRAGGRYGLTVMSQVVLKRSVVPGLTTAW